MLVVFVCISVKFLSFYLFIYFLHLCPFSYCRFMKSAPMFLDRNFKHLPKVANFLPPFGFKTQGEKLLSRQFGPQLDFLKCLEQRIFLLSLSSTDENNNFIEKAL